MTVPVWQRYTEQDIDELPPAMRAAARKAGGYWDDQTTTGDGTAAVVVPPKARVSVTVSTSLASIGIGEATLLITGATWGAVEVPVFAVVGPASAVPTASYDPLGLLCLPGDTLTPSVTIQAPPAATVVATLASGASDGIAVSSVTVRIPEHHPWDPDDLLDLPEAMRKQAAKDGWIDWHDGPTGAADTPLAAPPNSIVSVALAIAVPATDPPDELTGTLVLLSTTWQKLEIPIRVVVSDFGAVPLTDRIAVEQSASSDPFGVALSSTIGPDTDVSITIADADAGDVTTDVSTVHLGRAAATTQPVRVHIATNAMLGRYPIYVGESVDVGLRVTAFDGIYDRRFPLGLTLLPGSVTVAALQGSVEGQQDSTAVLAVQVVVSGGVKQLTFTGEALRYGVIMATLTQDLTGPLTTTLNLSFAIAPDAPTGETIVAIGWNAGDGVNAGTLSLPLRVQLRPESRTFTGEVVTPSGTALGGRVTVTVDNAGHGTFSGGMRATGLPSYTFRVRAVLRSADGQVAVAQQKSGEVYGTDTPGDREFDWNDPFDSDMAAFQWPAIRTASLAVSHAYELSGTLGTLEDLAVDFVEFLASSALIAATGGIGAVIFIGAELEVLTGVRPLGPAGFLGVIAAAGATALLGPAAIIPVLVGSSLIADAIVSYRRLNEAEIRFASSVFGDTLPYDRIMLTSMTGFGGREFTVPGVDGDILVNFGDGYDQPIQRTVLGRGYVVPGQLFIHELTHAWQIANANGTPEYFWRAMLAVLAGRTSYDYGAPGQPWSRFGLEQQAAIVEEWYSGTVFHAPGHAVVGRNADHPVGGLETDPYFGYISRNIRTGLA